jgi:hypothetical protein
MFMMMRRLRLMVVLGVGAVLLSACGEALEGAIADAETGYVSMDRDARQAVIDALQEVLDGDADLAAADRGRATAWLGVLLVRHGQLEAAVSRLAGFEEVADELVAADDPVSAVRGLGALGSALVGLQLDLNAEPPLQRALALAKEESLMRHPALFDTMTEMAWLTYLPGVGGNDGDTHAEATSAAEAILEQAAAIARANGGPDDPRLGTVDLMRANLLRSQSLDPALSPEALSTLAQNVEKSLVAALSRLPLDHPDRVPALEMLAELRLGYCEVESMELLSQEAVEVAKTIYGDTAKRTYRARTTYGDMVRYAGDDARGRQMILDARKVHYEDGGEGLQDPSEWEVTSYGCIE